jgi:heme-degrading monooxygenase HmoA
MILEVATLDVRSGQEPAFETPFASALPLIAATPGSGEHELHRCLEQPSCSLLLVRWRHLDDHTVGYRQSPRNHAWRALLHHFSDPFPTVEHFARVGDWPVTAGAQGAAW